MTAALINGLLGFALTYAIGTHFLDLSSGEVLLSFLASNVSGFISVLLTLQAERTPWIRKRWLNRSLKTWALIISLYLSIMVALSPALRDFHTLVYLFIPLLLSTGFAILAFGPVQDFLVRKQQRKSLVTN
jgi:hypothetical protein